jgi:hypothetical protein
MARRYAAPMSRADVIVRRYPGATFEGALELYEADLASMADAGWFPIAQVWGWDAVGSVGFLVSGSHWKPGQGTLAVTYRRSPAPTQTSSA